MKKNKKLGVVKKNKKEKLWKKVIVEKTAPILKKFDQEKRRIEKG